NDIHAEAAGDFDHTAPDAAGTDDTNHPVAQLEASQPGLREPPAPCPLHGLDEVARDGQQQGEYMLSHGRVAVVRHVRNSDAVLGAVVEIDVIVSGGSRRYQFQSREMRKHRRVKPRIDEWAGDLGIGEVGRIPLVQRLSNAAHTMVRIEAHEGLTLPFLGLEHSNVHSSLPTHGFTLLITLHGRIPNLGAVANRWMQATITYIPVVAALSGRP